MSVGDEGGGFDVVKPHSAHVHIIYTNIFFACLFEFRICFVIT